ncbi:MAG: hypothetical protein WD187_00250 [Candidatus Woykebacteria bacterium]
MNYEKWVVWLAFTPIMFVCVVVVVFLGAFVYAMISGSNVVAMQIVEIGTAVAVLSMIASVIITNYLVNS